MPRLLACDIFFLSLSNVCAAAAVYMRLVYFFASRKLYTQICLAWLVSAEELRYVWVWHFYPIEEPSCIFHFFLPPFFTSPHDLWCELAVADVFMGGALQHFNQSRAFWWWLLIIQWFLPSFLPTARLPHEIIFTF